VDTLRDQQEDHRKLAASLADDGVRFALGAWVDVTGRPKSKVVPIVQLPAMLAGSERYTPRGIGGLGSMNPSEDECVALPDVDTLRVLSWDKRIAFFNADLSYGGQGPFENCPRSILKSVVAQAADMGLRMNLGVETEFYLLDGKKLPEIVPLVPSSSLFPTPAYDVRSVLDSLDFLAEVSDHMDQADFGLYSFDQEGGNGQYELDFGYSDVLHTCDRLTYLRLLLTHVAGKLDGVVSFMPRPTTTSWGSGAHMNISLESVDTGANVFLADTDDSRSWTRTAQQFTAGLLRHAPALAALTCPTVNSYKRLRPKLADGTVSWAPVWARYGTNNRSCMLRLPDNRPAIENRSVDMTANMYLASALTLAAGLEGIREDLDPGEPVTDDTSNWHTEANRDGQRLPRTLLEALDAFAVDPLVHQVFSAGFVEDYLEMKNGEWDDYHSVVTPWEVERYLRDV
jgi:glutamine synthetase